MKSLEEQVRGRWHTDRWQASCPSCRLEQGWWDTSTGRICRASDCGYRLGTPVPAQAPPIIICSHCGDPLKPGEAGYSCDPCGREVRP